uniref:Uncharacterized protein n=1 Tax=Anopheles epiroticus TaxID=199890 RepID=A0A182P5L2_9DIPT
MNLIGVVVSFGALLALSVCAPVEMDVETDLVSYESVQGQEMYRFKYETSDGQFREEVGMLVNVGTPEQELMLVGMYGYKSQDGTMVMVMYTSGKKGYRARTVTKNAWNAELGKKALLTLLAG